MARVRSINPGFFLDDELAECEPLARILFAGLWCCADREGRLRDRPRRIKAETLPYDDCDIEKLLESLHGKGVIHRYEVEGEKFIAIPKWHRYQNPHPKEVPSLLPKPSGRTWSKLESSNGQAWSKHESSMNQARGKHKRSSSHSHSSSKDASPKKELCPECEAELAFDGDGTSSVHCPVCDFKESRP